MVAKPYYRVDFFNGHMNDVLFTSILVTTIETKTVAHIGTDHGRLLQVNSALLFFDRNEFLFKYCEKCFASY